MCFLLGQLTIRSQLLTEGKETIWQGFHEHFLSVWDMFKPNLLDYSSFSLDDVLLAITELLRGGKFTTLFFTSVQFSSAAQLCLTLRDPMDCSMPGFPVHHSWSLLKLMCIESVMPSTISSSVVPFSSCLKSFPASGSFPMSQLYA